jgi:hypothetical protein
MFAKNVALASILIQVSLLVWHFQQIILMNVLQINLVAKLSTMMENASLLTSITKLKINVKVIFTLTPKLAFILDCVRNCFNCSDSTSCNRCRKGYSFNDAANKCILSVGNLGSGYINKTANCSSAEYFNSSL